MQRQACRWHWVVRRRRVGFCLGVLVLLACGFVAPGLVAGEGVKTSGLPPVISPGPSYQVPVGEPRLVYRFGENAPAEVEAFWARNGRQWQIYWNAPLDAPQFLYPLEPELIVPPEVIGDENRRDELIWAIESFIDDNSDFFGVTTHELGSPHIFSLRTSRVIAFGQETPEGLTVRGSDLRFVVHGDGRLGWITAFVVRSMPAFSQSLLDLERLEGLADGWGVRLLDTTLQVGFPGRDVASALPIWCANVADTDGLISDVMLDARTGTVLSRQRQGAQPAPVPDGQGAGAPGFRGATCPILDVPPGPQNTRLVGVVEALLFDDVIVTEEELVIGEDGVPEPPPLPTRVKELPGIAVREVFTDGRETTRALSAATGFFAARALENPATLRADLAKLQCVPPGADCFSETPSPGAQLLPLICVLPSRFNIVEAANAPTPLPFLDADGNGLPDLQMTQELIRNNPNTYIFSFNRMAREGVDRREASWWAKHYLAAERYTRFLDRVFRDLELQDVYSPLPCIEAHPVLTPGEVGFFLVEPSVATPCTVFYAPYLLRQLPELVPEGQPLAFEPTTESLLQRHYGHYAVIALAGHRADDFPEIEKGIADVLSAFAHKSPEFGLDGNEAPTTRAFSLTSFTDPEAVRTQARKEVAGAFWELHQLLIAVDEHRQVAEFVVTAAIDDLLLWLGFRRARPEPPPVQEHRHRLFTPLNTLLDEILLIDDLPWRGGDGDITNGTPNHEHISTAFRGKRFFEAPFLRGDSNADGVVALVDALAVVNFLFVDRRFRHNCQNAMDFNNDAAIDLADVLGTLHYLFRGGPSPATGEVCGLDPEPPWDPGNLGCIDVSCRR